MKNWSARQREALLPKGGSGLELAGVAPGAHFPHRDAGPALLSYTRPARSWYVPGPCQPFDLRVCGKGTMSSKNVHNLTVNEKKKLVCHATPVLATVVGVSERACGPGRGREAEKCSEAACPRTLTTFLSGREGYGRVSGSCYFHCPPPPNSEQ